MAWLGSSLLGGACGASAAHLPASSIVQVAAHGDGSIRIMRSNMAVVFCDDRELFGILVVGSRGHRHRSVRRFNNVATGACEGEQDAKASPPARRHRSSEEVVS